MTCVRLRQLQHCQRPLFGLDFIFCLQHVSIPSTCELCRIPRVLSTSSSQAFIASTLKPSYSANSWSLWPRLWAQRSNYHKQQSNGSRARIRSNDDGCSFGSALDASTESASLCSTVECSDPPNANYVTNWNVKSRTTCVGSRAAVHYAPCRGVRQWLGGSGWIWVDLGAFGGLAF